MKVHILPPGRRLPACGAGKNEPATRADATVSCQRCTAWNLGREDGREGITFGVTYDGDPSSPRSVAYDEGRTYGERERVNARLRRRH